MTVKFLLRALKAYVTSPKKRIRLAVVNETGRKLYENFNQRHKRYKIIRNKTVGVALIDLAEFPDFDSFQRTVSGKNSAVYFSRRCSKEGYTVELIDPNNFQEAILEIHLSAKERQGRPIDASYRQRTDYPIDVFNKYVGVFYGQQLVAYCWLIETGELILLNRLMGHDAHLKKGIMYLLVMHAIKLGFEKRAQSGGAIYMMYDTYYGASEGLKLFKKRLGFYPSRVKWLK